LKVIMMNREIIHQNGSKVCLRNGVQITTASQSALDMVARYVDEVGCLNVRGDAFYAVADAYVEWHDLSDGEVMTYL